MGATLPQQITRVIIPASIPTVLAGLRLGGALAIIGVVVSEMLTAVGGHRLSRDADTAPSSTARVCSPPS